MDAFISLKAPLPYCYSLIVIVPALDDQIHFQLVLGLFLFCSPIDANLA